MAPKFILIAALVWYIFYWAPAQSQAFELPIFREVEEEGFCGYDSDRYSIVLEGNVRLDEESLFELDILDNLNASAFSVNPGCKIQICGDRLDHPTEGKDCYTFAGQQEQDQSASPVSFNFKDLYNKRLSCTCPEYYDGCSAPCKFQRSQMDADGESMVTVLQSLSYAPAAYFIYICQCEEFPDEDTDCEQEHYETKHPLSVTLAMQLILLLFTIIYVNGNRNARAN